MEQCTGIPVADDFKKNFLMKQAKDLKNIPVSSRAWLEDYENRQH